MTSNSRCIQFVLIISVLLCLFPTWAVETTETPAPAVEKTVHFAPEQMRATAIKADVILIGVSVDSQPHQATLVTLLQALIKAGRRPVLLFDVLDEQHEGKEVQNGLVEAEAAWGKSMSLAYQPLLVLAEAHRLEIHHAGLPLTQQVNVFRYGLTALPKTRRDMLFGGISPNDIKALAERLVPVVAQSRDVKPEDPKLAGFLAVQMANDAYMADRVLRVANASCPVVLFAAIDAVREASGVPAYLKMRGYSGRVLPILMLREDGALVTAP